MGHKLHGVLNLTKIPKRLITENKNGEKVLWVDIVPNRGGADQYGNTHSIQIYDKEAGKAIYLGNLKDVEFGQKAESAPAAPTAPAQGANNDDPDSDLPF